MDCCYIDSTLIACDIRNDSFFDVCGPMTW